MNSPTGESVSDLIRQISAKAVEFGCHDEDNDWKCPLYDSLATCDGRSENCYSDVKSCVEDLFRKNEIVVKNNGIAIIRNGYVRLLGKAYVSNANNLSDSVNVSYLKG